MNSFDVEVDYICNEKSGITVKYHHVSCPAPGSKIKVFNLNTPYPPDVIIAVKLLFYAKGIYRFLVMWHGTLDLLFVEVV